MITITRLLARRIASVFRRALSLTGALAATHPVRLTAGPHGLTIEAATANCAVAYHCPTPLPPEEFLVPLEVFKSCGGSKSDSLSLVLTDDGQIMARWEEGIVPRSAHWKEPDAAKVIAMPDRPPAFTTNPADLLVALREAIETTDRNATRYVLGCVQLRGETGEIAATDGRQLFKQSGFSFGFTDDMLLHGNSVFAAKELVEEKSIGIGRTDSHVAFGVGSWTIYLPIEKEGRFPRIDDAIPSVVNAQTTLDLSRNDLAFLAENLHRLPGGDTDQAPVTVDLNGCVAVRAQDATDPNPTELVLRDSHRTGHEIRLVTDRRYLERAARLGFERIHWTSAKTPAVCRDDHRTFVWMPLETSSAIKPNERSVIIESRPSKPASVTQPQRLTPIPTPQEQKAIMKSNLPEPLVSPVASKPTTTPSGIEQAVALRTTLRELLTQTNELVRSLKRQQQQQRLMKSTLASLRQLQTVA